MPDRSGSPPQILDDNCVTNVGRRDVLKAGAAMTIGAAIPSLIASTSSSLA
jgi:hypothetical protein